MGSVTCKSLLAGVLIGLGIAVNMQVENPYIGAMLFSLALLTIIEMDLKLYTGKIGFIGETPINELIQIMIGNLIGVMIIFSMTYEKIGLEKIVQVANEKFINNTFLELFSYGIMCGMLMYIAVYCKNKIITIFCIMTFILSGWEHCIADFPFLCVAFSLKNLQKYICIIIGNSIGSMFVHVSVND